LKEKKRFDGEQNEKRLNGTVKWFDGAKGYGFIKREDAEKIYSFTFLQLRMQV